MFHLPAFLGSTQKFLKFMNNKTQMLDFAHVGCGLFFLAAFLSMNSDLQEEECILGNKGIQHLEG